MTLTASLVLCSHLPAVMSAKLLILMIALRLSLLISSMVAVDFALGRQSLLCVSNL